jgi:hypothetical protein
MASIDTIPSVTSPNSVVSKYNLVVVNVSGSYDTDGDTSSDVKSSEPSSDSTSSDTSVTAGSTKEKKEGSSKVTCSSVRGTTTDRGMFHQVNYSSGINRSP